MTTVVAFSRACRPSLHSVERSPLLETVCQVAQGLPNLITSSGSSGDSPGE
jgi:hypothetical protein